MAQSPGSEHVCKGTALLFEEGCSHRCPDLNDNSLINSTPVSEQETTAGSQVSVKSFVFTQSKKKKKEDVFQQMHRPLQ